MDQPAQEGDIRPGADWGVDIREGRGAGKTRVDVDDGSAPLLCLQHEAEGDWVASAMFEPMITTQSLLARSHCAVVAAPRPKEAPRLGTEELCHMRAWFSIQTMPSPPPKNFLIR